MEYFCCPIHKERIPRYLKHDHDDCFEKFEYYENIEKDTFLRALFEYLV